MDDPSAVKLLLAAVAGLVAALGFIWRWAEARQSALIEELKACQAKLDEEHGKRIADLKEHWKASELFLRVLEKRPKRSSDPPSAS